MNNTLRYKIHGRNDQKEDKGNVYGYKAECGCQQVQRHADGVFAHNFAMCASANGLMEQIVLDGIMAQQGKRKRTHEEYNTIK